MVSGAVVPVLCRMEVAPTSGTTVVVQAPFDHVFVTNSSTLAALTINLPTTGQADGDMIRLSNRAAITALTMSPTVLGVPSGLTAGQGMTFCWSVPQGSWFVF